MSSRLIIEARYHPSIPTRFPDELFSDVPFYSSLAFVEVSVTSAYGVPRTDLKESNFTVTSIGSPPQFPGAELARVIKEDIKGFYAMFVSLPGPPLKVGGEYLVAIVVQAGTAKSARGQTLLAFNKA